MYSRCTLLLLAAQKDQNLSKGRKQDVRTARDRDQAPCPMMLMMLPLELTKSSQYLYDKCYPHIFRR